MKRYPSGTGHILPNVKDFLEAQPLSARVAGLNQAMGKALSIQCLSHVELGKPSLSYFLLDAESSFYL